MPIIEIEMHLRDQITLDWLKQRLADGPDKLTYAELSTALKCHPNTARNIIARLRGAGHIEIVDNHRPGGYTYRLKGKRNG